MTEPVSRFHATTSAARRATILGAAAMSLMVALTGCSPERSYHDTTLNLTVERLDPELDNRWGTSGVVVTETGSGGDLGVGDLVTHVVLRVAVTDEASVRAALKNAMAPRRHIWNVRERETSDASAVLEIERTGSTLYTELASSKPKEWAKHGLAFDGTRVSDIRDGYQGDASRSPAEAAGIVVGDRIVAVIDEDAVASPAEFRKAMARAKDAASIYLYTQELTGIRLETIRVMGELAAGNASVLSRLIELLNTSQDLATRRTVARSLARLARHQTDTVLLQAVLPLLHADTEPDAEIRRTAAGIVESLVQVLPKETFDQTVMDTLAVALTDSEPGVQFKAGVVLSTLGESAFAYIEAALAEGNPDRVRDIAATALGDIGGTRARDTLIATLRSTTSVPLQLTIATALAKINDAPSRTELQSLAGRSSGGVQELVRQLLAASNPPAAPSS